MPVADDGCRAGECAVYLQDSAVVIYPDLPSLPSRVIRATDMGDGCSQRLVTFDDAHAVRGHPNLDVLISRSGEPYRDCGRLAADRGDSHLDGVI